MVVCMYADMWFGHGGVCRYEDNLSELGTTRACLRFREFEDGWEMRIRWWSLLVVDAAEILRVEGGALFDEYEFLHPRVHS